MTTNLDNLDQITKVFSFMEFRLSWSVMRMAELLKWVDSGEYQSLLDTGKLPQKTEDIEPEPNPSDWDFISKL